VLNKIRRKAIYTDGYTIGRQVLHPETDGNRLKV